MSGRAFKAIGKNSVFFADSAHKKTSDVDKALTRLLFACVPKSHFFKTKDLELYPITRIETCLQRVEKELTFFQSLQSNLPYAWKKLILEDTYYLRRPEKLKTKVYSEAEANGVLQTRIGAAMNDLMYLNALRVVAAEVK
jgi:hypothetical protein